MQSPLSPLVRRDPKWLLCAAVLASSMGFIDSSVTAIALPAIRESLGGSLTAIAWVHGGYLLTLSALILSGGALSDRLGIVTAFKAGIAGFTLASLLCAVAPNLPVLIAARLAQGVAAAFMVPGSMTLVARAYGPDKSRALGLWAAAATATTAGGPIAGGLLLTLGGTESWRLIFALNLPLGLLALALLQREARPDAPSPDTPLDLMGACLAALALGLGSLALTELSGLAGGAALLALIALLIHEARCPHPMIRLGLFAERTFALTNLATLLLYVGLTGTGLYLPMTAMALWQVTPLSVTLAFLPVSLLIAAASPAAARLEARIGPRLPLSLGAGLVALSYGATALALPHGGFYSLILPAQILAGAGLALLVAPLTSTVMKAAPEAEQGAASGINNATARIAALIAVALMGQVVQHLYGPLGPTTPGFGLAATGSAHQAATLRAYSGLAATASALAALAALASLFLPQATRRR
jgi:EmrB/QacA subfamily drug resistance transporter